MKKKWRNENIDSIKEDIAILKILIGRRQRRKRK